MREIIDFTARQLQQNPGGFATYRGPHRSKRRGEAGVLTRTVHNTLFDFPDFHVIDPDAAGDAEAEPTFGGMSKAGRAMLRHKFAVY